MAGAPLFSSFCLIGYITVLNAIRKRHDLSTVATLFILGYIVFINLQSLAGFFVALYIVACEMLSVRDPQKQTQSKFRCSFWILFVSIPLFLAFSFFLALQITCSTVYPIYMARWIHSGTSLKQLHDDGTGI